MTRLLDVFCLFETDLVLNRVQASDIVLAFGGQRTRIASNDSNDSYDSNAFSSLLLFPFVCYYKTIIFEVIFINRFDIYLTF